MFENDVQHSKILPPSWVMSQECEPVVLILSEVSHPHWERVSRLKLLHLSWRLEFINLDHSPTILWLKQHLNSLASLQHQACRPMRIVLTQQNEPSSQLTLFSFSVVWALPETSPMAVITECCLKLISGPAGIEADMVMLKQERSKDKGTVTQRRSAAGL